MLHCHYLGTTPPDGQVVAVTPSGQQGELFGSFIIVTNVTKEMKKKKKKSWEFDS